ncbi:MAG: hypothetical protein WCI64_09095 [Chlorobium sp.]
MRNQVGGGYKILRENLIKEEGFREIEADSERWDALMATDKAQSFLEKMAAEALAGLYFKRVGKQQPIYMQFVYNGA